MAEKDIMQRSLEGFNDVFADIVNGFLFHGEDRVKEDSLEDAVTNSYYKTEKIRGQDRDVVKFWNKGQIRIALFGFENQTQPEKEFPLRVIGYDGAAYRRQLSVNDALKRKNKPPKPLYPVITLALYFGIDRHWDHSLNLKDCFAVPEGLNPYVNDYKVNLFEVAWLSDEEVSRFKSDFRLVAEYLTQMRKDPEHYRPSRQEIIHVREFFHLMSVMSGNTKIEKNYHVIREEGGNVCMRDYFTIMQEKWENEYEVVKKEAQEMVRRETEAARKAAQEEARKTVREETEAAHKEIEAARKAARQETEAARKESEAARKKSEAAQQEVENAKIEIKNITLKATLVNLKSIMKNLNLTLDQAFDGLGIAEEDREMYRSRL